jgi:hypothetical protein
MTNKQNTTGLFEYLCKLFVAKKVQIWIPYEWRMRIQKDGKVSGQRNQGELLAGKRIAKYNPNLINMKRFRTKPLKR